jgi:hypothetical protein
LGRAPAIGSPYITRREAVIRRGLLRSSKNHVYYEVDPQAGVVMMRIPDGLDRPFRLDPITRFGQTRSPIPAQPIARFGRPDR